MINRQLTNGVLALWLSLTVLPSLVEAQTGQPSGTPAPQSNDTLYATPYMNAATTPLSPLENGALVSPGTVAYLDLDRNSPKRASYDREAVIEVAAGVWTLASDSIINVHVIEGPDGLIVYDTGDNRKDGERFYKMLRSVSDRPIKAIIYSHEHYTLGTQVFVEKEANRGNRDIMIIGHPNTNTSMARTGGVSALHPEVSGVLMARSLEQFNFFLPDEGPDARFKNTIVTDPEPGFVPVNTPVENAQTLSVAGLDITFYTEDIATDTNNQVLAWLPSRGIALNNIIWGWFPNLYSARGGHYRNPRGWMTAVEKLRQLKPAILLSTHSTSLNNSKDIDARLLAYRDGIAFVLDQTLKGILQGQGPDELRYSIRLPQYLAETPILVQNYGEVSTMGPRIFTAIFGQFGRNAVSLNKLHPRDEAARMIAAMGGAEKVTALIRTAQKDGDYLWAAQLADYLVKTEPDSRRFRTLEASALRQMGYRAVATNARAWYLTRARELEGKTAILKNAPANSPSVASNIRDYVDYYRVRINPERSNETDALLQIAFDDKHTYALHIRRAVVTFIDNPETYPRKPDVAVKIPLELWAGIFNNTADPGRLIDENKIRVTQGDAAEAKRLFSLFDPVYDWQNDPALKALADIAGQGEKQP